MKNLFLVLFTVFLIGFTVYSSGQNLSKEINGKGILKITIDGFENDKGHSMIALGNSRGTFTGSEKIFLGAAAAIKDGKAECIFKDIPFGRYTLSVYHDENDNKKLDKNLFGAPTEKYGFSNNARATFGPPKYEEALFIFDKPEMSVSITVK